MRAEFPRVFGTGEAGDRHGASRRPAGLAACMTREAGLEGLVEARAADLARAAGGRLRCRDVRQRERPALRVQGRHRLDRDHGLCHRAAARRDHRAVRRQRAVGPDEHRWRWPPRPGAAFVREIFTGTYASDMGPWTPDAGAAMRYRDRLGRQRPRACSTTSRPSSPDSLDRRSLPDRARSAVFSSIPDAILVSGAITGEAAAMRDLEAVKKVLPDTPVLANTGRQACDGGRRAARSPTAASSAPR